MDLIDKQHTETPFYGSRRLTAYLKNGKGYDVNRKRVQRVMKLMRIEAIYPKPKTTNRDKEHKIYPYLLRDVEVVRPDQVWSTDITYIRVGKGFAYLKIFLVIRLWPPFSISKVILYELQILRIFQRECPVP